jgi:hypothetical protein
MNRGMRSPGTAKPLAPQRVKWSSLDSGEEAPEGGPQFDHWSNRDRTGQTSIQVKLRVNSRTINLRSNWTNIETCRDRVT